MAADRGCQCGFERANTRIRVFHPPGLLEARKIVGKTVQVKHGSNIRRVILPEPALKVPGCLCKRCHSASMEPIPTSTRLHPPGNCEDAMDAEIHGQVGA